MNVLVPRRIQLSRKAGWKLPANTVIVDRRSKEWGNPYRVGPDQSAADAVKKFEAFVLRRPEWIATARQHLRGKNLACWCPLDAPCHADVWLRLANSPLRFAFHGAHLLDGGDSWKLKIVIEQNSPPPRRRYVDCVAQVGPDFVSLGGGTYSRATGEWIVGGRRIIAVCDNQDDIKKYMRPL